MNSEIIDKNPINDQNNQQLYSCCNQDGDIIGYHTGEAELELCDQVHFSVGDEENHYNDDSYEYDANEMYQDQGNQEEEKIRSFFFFFGSYASRKLQNILTQDTTTQKCCQTRRTDKQTGLKTSRAKNGNGGTTVQTLRYAHARVHVLRRKLQQTRRANNAALPKQPRECAHTQKIKTSKRLKQRKDQ